MLVGLSFIGSLLVFLATANAKKWEAVPTIIAGISSLLLFFALATVSSSVVIVPAGHRAVVFSKVSGINQVPLEEGFHLIMPVVSNAVLFDVRIQKVEFEATASSKDLQDVATKVAINFEPEVLAMSSIYQTYGLAYVDNVIHPAVQESVKSVTAKYTAEELITRREDVKKEVHAALTELMRPAHLKLVETYITNFSFSEGFTHAIEGKQIAEQEALKARRVLEQVKIEAEQKIASARAEAESLRLQKEQITDKMIQLRRVEAQMKAIEKWDGKMPGIMLGNGATPLVDLSKLTSKSDE